MKFFIYILNLLVLFNSLYSAVPTCSQHQEETKSIKDVACNYLVEAHKLTGDSIGSYVVTAYDLCWDAIKFHSSYSQFTNTFQGCIQNCNKKGKFLASNRLYKGCDEVGNLFLDLYDNCILNHHNYRSVFERGKIHFDRGNLEACLEPV